MGVLPGGFGPERTPYDAIGGDTEVRALVDAFYDHVQSDSPHVRGMHPEDDTTSRQKLYEFLSGWLGGPPLYIERHGHPRLRMRHAPFPIDGKAVEEWLMCMSAAMDDRGIEGELRAFLDERFSHVAHFMKNTG